MLDDLSAEQFIDQAPRWLQPYVKIDVEGFARDLELGGEVSIVERSGGGVWLFETTW